MILRDGGCLGSSSGGLGRARRLDTPSIEAIDPLGYPATPAPVETSDGDEIAFVKARAALLS